MQVLLVGLALLLAAAAAALAWRATSFRRQIDALAARVGSAAPALPVDLSTLPPLVLAFAQRNGGTVGAAPALVATQRAQMRLAPDQPFFPLTATQVFGTRRPEFVWHATGAMLGIVPLEVIDSYVGGTGQLEARIAGALTVARARGGATDAGEAMRFLAELPFNPDAILNTPMLRWQQFDPHQVAVSTPVGDGEARIVLHFDSAGDIDSIEAPARPRTVGTTTVPTPWRGRYADYRPLGPYRLPHHAEVLWDLPTGEFIYWRGTMTSLTPSPR